MSMLSPGDTAPDFTVTATDGSDVTLSEYRGRRVILYFYPRDDEAQLLAVRRRGVERGA